MSSVSLSKADVRRALVRHHFAPCATQEAAFDRLRSIQFDPIAPVGCNHDLVLQARVQGYKVGDWQKLAYEDRHIYDGWDKMASLVPFEGWPLRRYIYAVGRRSYEKKIFVDHKDAVESILKEIADRGPMMPKDFEFQQRREEWKGSWFGPSVTKQTLRALWHSGLIMTSGRKNGQHLYDLTERVVPQRLRDEPLLEAKDARRELAMERHRAMGIVRPAAPPEIWSYQILYYDKREAIAGLVERGQILPVEIEGVKTHATPEFLALLDQPSIEPRVVFIAPLDHVGSKDDRPPVRFRLRMGDLHAPGQAKVGLLRLARAFRRRPGRSRGVLEPGRRSRTARVALRRKGASSGILAGA